MVRLRLVQDDDFDILFEQMRDPEAVTMAAFTAADPDDRAAFDQHIRRNLANPSVIERAIEVEDGRLAGTIASFVIEGDTEITYWLGREFWGRGVAGQALAAFLPLVTARPLHARAASDNVGSLRVLQRAGFEVTGTDVGYANARKSEIEETLLVLRS
jgi:RimJ/RimL family protein N-acetyltransferase